MSSAMLVSSARSSRFYSTGKNLRLEGTAGPRGGVDSDIDTATVTI